MDQMQRMAAESERSEKSNSCQTCHPTWKSKESRNCV